MNRIFKTAILGAALAATTLATLPAANAKDWNRWHHGHGRHHNGDALAAGVVGLAAGALIAGALSNPQPRYSSYDDDYDYREVRPAPVRRYYAEPRVVYADRYAEPWTRDWYEYCSDRYRSFNARSGTFTGNDGEQHFCVAN